MRRGSKNNKKHQNLREKNLWKKIYVGASTAEWPNHGLKSFIYTCSNWFLMNFGCTFFLELIPLQRAVSRGKMVLLETLRDFAETIMSYFIEYLQIEILLKCSSVNYYS